MFDYDFNGVKLSMQDMEKISDHYNSAVIAEELLREYPEVFPCPKDALNAGRQIHGLMSTYGFAKNVAVQETLRRSRQPVHS